MLLKGRRQLLLQSGDLSVEILILLVQLDDLGRLVTETLERFRLYDIDVFLLVFKIVDFRLQGLDLLLTVDQLGTDLRQLITQFHLLQLSHGAL